METYRSISVVVGVLYLLGFVAGILSIARAVDDPEYLTKSALNAKQVNKAAGFQFLMAVFCLGIAIVLYPLLKTYNETLAVGFLSFRITAVLFILIGTVMLLLIVKLSEEYRNVNSSESSYFQMTGSLLKTGRDLVNHVIMIIMLCIGGIMLYIIMIQSGLIPIWLSLWGIAGSLMAILASILVMIKYIDVITPTYVLLNVPIVLQEIVFAVWLIVKGFNQV